MDTHVAKMVTQILDRIHRLDAPMIIAIDGRCGSGKTTLARALQEQLHCSIIPMDDFFLRPSQRTEARLATPGENIDWERFSQEVLLPLSMGEAVSYRPFRCDTQTLGQPRHLNAGAITVVEGSYSCHSQLRDTYTLKIFLTTDSETQLERIRIRNGEAMLQRFQNTWIPMEEAYFNTLPEGLFDFVFTT